MTISCSDVCEAVSEIVCAKCPDRKECLLGELAEGDFHEKLLECLWKMARALKASF